MAPEWGESRQELLFKRSLVPWLSGVTHTWGTHGRWGHLLFLEAEGSPLSLSRLGGAPVGEVRGAISILGCYHHQRSQGRGEGAGGLRDTVPRSPFATPENIPNPALGTSGLSVMMGWITRCQDTGASSA